MRPIASVKYPSYHVVRVTCLTCEKERVFADRHEWDGDHVPWIQCNYLVKNEMTKCPWFVRADVLRWSPFMKRRPGQMDIQMDGYPDGWMDGSPRSDPVGRSVGRSVVTGCSFS